MHNYTKGSWFNQTWIYPYLGCYHIIFNKSFWEDFRKKLIFFNLPLKKDAYVSFILTNWIPFAQVWLKSARWFKKRIWKCEPVCLISVYLTCLTVKYLPVYMLTIYLSTYWSPTCLHVDHLPVDCLPMYLLTVYPSTWLPVDRPPVYLLTVYLSTCLPVDLLPFYLSTCLPVDRLPLFLFTVYLLFYVYIYRIPVNLSSCVFIYRLPVDCLPMNLVIV